MSTTVDEYEEEYDEYYDEDEGNISGFTILAIAVAVLFVFAAVVWFAYKRGMQIGENRIGQVPVITAEANPAKTEQPIAIDSNQNEEVNNLLAGNQPEVLVDTQTADDPLAGFEQTASVSEQSEDIGTSTSAIAQQEEETQPVTTAQNNTANAASEETTSAPAEDQPAVETASVTTAQPDPAPATTAAIASTHVVQVGAFRSEQEATTYFSTLQSRYEALLSGKTADIQRADLGERGVYYRLRIAPFDGNSAASQYCTELKAAGQDCLVRAR